MNPLVFTVLAWEKERELIAERQPTRLHQPGDPSVEIMPGEKGPAPRFISWKRSSIPVERTAIVPAHDCACAD